MDRPRGWLIIWCIGMAIVSLFIWPVFINERLPRWLRLRWDWLNGSLTRCAKVMSYVYLTIFILWMSSNYL